MLCASAVGNWIDRSSTRLPPMLISISSNHGAIVASYLCWLLWPVMVGNRVDGDTPSRTPFSSLPEGFLFGCFLLMDVVHDLGATANMLSLQRDWVPVLVGPGTSAEASILFCSSATERSLNDLQPYLIPRVDLRRSIQSWQESICYASLSPHPYCRQLLHISTHVRHGSFCS